MSGISRLAIVNRGEPAIRALSAVAELNREGDRPPITAIVVYTDPDAGAWFVRLADEAICLGPATFVDPADGRRKSAYLDVVRVVTALQARDVDAVWVGWGFVAEHAEFAKRCEDAGIVFVGPTSSTISLLGDKLAAKRLAATAGVPALACSADAVETDYDARAQADRLGYPVVLKAAAGGGGRGIRVVRNPDELARTLESARAEASLAFGDARIFVEHYLDRARHVEVQIIADGEGTTWAVGVRDCTLQRRHQKVIEESASTALEAASEQAIRDAAVRIAQVAGYRNAGTVEFLVDPKSGDFYFMEVNTRLQVEHPVTEETAGVDLVKLQLHLARGGTLDGPQPTAHGHAVEARLCAEDPEQDFAPAPGRVTLWRPPTGPGIRVDSGVSEGDVVAPEFDSLIAKIVAWGRDRAEAIARLRRALDRTIVVIDGGTTNRSFLLSLLDSNEFRNGDIDNHWLDRLTAQGAHLPQPQPVAVLVAAVMAHDVDEAAARAAFHAGARRGRPDAREAAGHQVRVRYRGCAYQLGVFRTGPEHYLVHAADADVPLRIQRLDQQECRVTVLGRTHRVLATAQRSSFLIDMDGGTHRVYRDDGGIVRAGWPAFVISVLVKAGDRVAAGDPVVVLESMKMETTVTAPFAGEIADVMVAANTQVEQAAPLLSIRETAGSVTSAVGRRLDFVALSCAQGESGDPYEILHSYLLGFELDPVGVEKVKADVRKGPRKAEFMPAEERLLELFADVSALFRSQPDPLDDDFDTSAQEYVLSFLQWLDADRAGLPDPFRAQLLKVLARYGVHDLSWSPALEEAVVWMWRSFQRADELAPVVADVLERRLRESDLAAGQVRPELRSLIARLAAAAQVRYPEVAELSRDLLFRYFDEPLLERAVASVYAEMSSHLDALEADPHRADRPDRVERLVWCPQPMRGMLRRRWGNATTSFREVLLDVHVRRFYRIRPLHDLRFAEYSGQPIGAADYEFDGKVVHVVATYAPFADTQHVARAISEHLATVDPDRLIVADLVLWRAGRCADTGEIATEAQRMLGACEFGRPMHRIDLTVTTEGTEPEHQRTHHVTFRQGGAGFTEELLYRNLHPMIAKRLDLWRLSNFSLTRMRSAEDVYLFRGVAHDNPRDVRLFALAEVRDLTPVRDDADRVIRLPLLERMGLQCLAAMRRAMSEAPASKRPQSNRIVLHVRPPFTTPRRVWRTLVRAYQPLAEGANLQKIVLLVRIPDGDGLRDTVLEFTGHSDAHVMVR